MMSKKNNRPGWHEPIDTIGDELNDPIEDTIEVGTVVLVDGPIDPVPLTAGGGNREDCDTPRSFTDPMPDLNPDLNPDLDSAAGVTDTLTDKAQDAVGTLTDKAQDVKATATEAAADTAQDIAQKAAQAASTAKAAVSSAGSTAKSVIGGAAGKIGSAGAAGAQGAGTALWAVVQRSPLQALLVFSSLIWLIRHHKAAASQPPVSLSDAATDAAEKAGSLAGQVQATAATLGGQVQEQAQRSSGWFSRTLQENPLAVGAMAVVFGAGLGFAVPETGYEHRLLGKTRDSLADKAQEAAQDLTQKVQNVAQSAVHEAIETAKEEAKTQGLAG